MTIIAIWYESADDCLWSVADTRISSPGQAGGLHIRSDSGAKLYMLPVTCLVVASEACPQPYPYFSTTFGFGFAGDVLPAAMTFGTASTLLQSLVSVTKSSPPALRDIAELVRRVGERFSRECLGSSNGIYGNFEAAVFGNCVQLKRFAVYHLSPGPDQSNFAMSISEHLPTDNLGITMLGSKKEELKAHIDRIRNEGDELSRTVRIPKLAVEAMVKEGAGDVGGSLSIGIATRERYNLCWRAEPIEPGRPKAVRTFNGIDIDKEIGTVGDHWVGTMGIA